MRIQILGTAAAEGWPGLFCDCHSCCKARELGGKDIRTRSSLQIDDVYKIDFSPDTLHHVHKYGLKLQNLRHLLFTHSHQDHMDREELLMIIPPFGHNNFAENPLNVYMSSSTAKTFASGTTDIREMPFKMHHLHPFETVNVGEMVVTPLLAAHDPNEECLFYILEKDGKTVMYASDTGPFPQATWDYILTRHFDMLIIECTIGPNLRTYNSHMSFQDVVDIKEKMLSSGAIKSDTPCWITHFSHNAKVTHDEFVEIAAPYGINVAYDGVILKV